MHLHSPSLVLVPDTFIATPDSVSGKKSSSTSLLVGYICEEFPGAQLEPVGRRYWNDTGGWQMADSVVYNHAYNMQPGLDFILQLCVEDDERAGTILAVSNKCAYTSPIGSHLTRNHRYYALAATCALFKHAESKLNARFAAGSLRIRYVPVEGTMMIDPDTARNLELVGNMTYKKSAHSLFGYVGLVLSTLY